MHRKYCISILVIISYFLFSPVTWAQNGRIRGVVYDSNSQEPLAHTNVWLEPSGIGTVSDSNGNFILMNVSPGIHQLHIDYMGYKSFVIDPITVVPLTITRVRAPLEKTILKGEELVVYAKEEQVELTATGDQKIFSEEYMNQVPFKDVATLIAAQSGAVLNEESIHIRGGRSDELGVYLDGVLLNNPYTRNVNTSFLFTGLEQASYRPGAMNVQNGGFNSGVVHLSSKQGGKRLSGKFDLETDQWLAERDKRLGAYSYGYSRSNAELHGPLPFSQKKVRFFVNLDYLYTKDRSPSWLASVQPDQFVSDIDRLIQLQPKPLLLNGPKRGNRRKQWGGLFNLSGRFKGLFVKMGGSFHQTDDQKYDHSRSAFNWQQMPLFSQHDWSLYSRINWMISSKLHFVVDINTYRFLSILQDPKIQDDFINWANPDDIPNITTWGQIVPILGEFANFDGHGRIFGHYMKDESQRNTIHMHGSWQVSPQHHIETGIEWQKNLIRFYSLSFPVSSALHRLSVDGQFTQEDRLAVYQRYADYVGYDATGKSHVQDGNYAPRKPSTTSFYVQENYETPHFVCQLGVRFDYIETAQKQLKDPYFIPFNSTGQVDIAALDESATFFEVAPRIGFAFPVSDRSTFHFHYGKYVQAAPYANSYLNWYTLGNDLQAGAAPFLANPALKPVKTTSYEIGCDIASGSKLVFDVTCFYKEIQNQIQMKSMIGADPMTYSTFINGDYGTSKGLTWDVFLKRTHHLAGQCSYTLMWSEGTGSTPYTHFSLATGQSETYPTLVSPLQFDQRHAMHVSVDFKMGKEEGVEWQGNYPFSHLSVMLWYTYGSGFPYTPVEVTSHVYEIGNRNPLGLINNQQFQANSLCHLKIEKAYNKEKWSLTPYVSILNLFNAKTVKQVYDATGMPDEDGWLETPEGIAWQEANPATVAWYRARLADPGHYGMPRQIRVGCKFQF